MRCLNGDTEVVFATCTITNSFTLAFHMVALLAAGSPPLVLIHKVRMKDYMQELQLVS